MSAQTVSPFDSIFSEKKLVLLDGGLASELEFRGENLNDELWSAKILIENPDAIFEVHKAYFESGADVATTSTYQASFEGFRKRGLNLEEARGLFRKSVMLAHRARECFDSSSRRLVAASMGNYGAYLADGSEYRGHYKISKSELKAFHKTRFEVFKELHRDGLVDLLAFETVPSRVEIEIILEMVDQPSVGAWISCSLKDSEHISDGTSLREIARAIGDHPRVFAFGVNCIPPAKVAKAIDVLAQNSLKPILAYPNSGEIYDARSKIWSGNSMQWLGFLQDWYERGVRVIGGCCRTRPQDIHIISKWRDSMARGAAR